MYPGPNFTNQQGGIPIPQTGQPNWSGTGAMGQPRGIPVNFEIPFTQPHIQPAQLASNIVSYNRIGSSQESRINSISQFSQQSYNHLNAAPHEVQSFGTSGDNSSQARYQEYIANTRHLELMEQMNDLRKRVTFIEEHMVTYHNHTMAVLKGLRSKVESDASRAIGLTIESNNAQRGVINDLKNKLDYSELHLERIERKMDLACTKSAFTDVASVRFRPETCVINSFQDVDIHFDVESLSLNEDILQTEIDNLRQQFKSDISIQKNQTCSSDDEKENYPAMSLEQYFFAKQGKERIIETDSCMEGFELWSENGGTVEINTACNPVKSFEDIMKDDQTEIDSPMTEPIQLA